MTDAELDEIIVGTVRSATITEMRRCAEIVSMARFREIDQDFRVIIHFIESGMSIEQIKESQK